MDPTKWRISKACEECRVRKIRCDGGNPCQRCQTRNVACEYRKKARNRMKREVTTPSSLSVSQGAQSIDVRHDPKLRPREIGATPYDSSSKATSRSSIQNHSVAATHRASPSVFLQLYYGPSSTFSLLNSIYHQVEGTLPAPNAAKEVEEIGPGLDLFNIRRLYFGDLVGVEPNSVTDTTTGMFLDRSMADKFMDLYLSTFWHILPVWSKEEYRARLHQLYNSVDMCTTENPDTIIILLTMAIGASLLEKDEIARHLFRKAKKWAVSLDDMVNLQTVQISLLMSHFCAEDARPNSGFLFAGTAIRKAVAAGLHKDVTGTGHAQDGARQGRITIWSAYFWETWLCFSLGRPSSFPEADIDVPFPKEQKMLQSLVLLSRLMSKCVARIYREHHESLLPIWNAANEIRRDLRQFAKQQQQDLNFGLSGDTFDGELGVCQSIVSTMYHHTLLLTFRPFLVLRAKLQQEMAQDGRPGAVPKPPAWLDTACEYCIDAARHAISYLSGAVQKNELCRAIKYHGFFIEGASQVLAFYLLQDKDAGRENLPWIQLAARSLELIRPRSRPSSHPVDLLSNLEQMVQAVYPDFRVDPPNDAPSSPGPNTAVQDAAAAPVANPTTLHPAVLPPAFPFTPFGLEESGPPSTESPSTSTANPEGPTDLTAAEMGWNFDFSTMNMEAFLTIDPNITPDFSAYR